MIKHVRFVIPAKAGIQHKIASAGSGFQPPFIWLKCYISSVFLTTHNLQLLKSIDPIFTTEIGHCFYVLDTPIVLYDGA